MKKITLLGTGLVLLLGVSTASAMTFGAAESYSLSTADTVADNLYAVGGTVNVAGIVEGDLLTAGGDVTVLGTVTEDIFVAGGSLNLQGDVGEDLRFAGGDINVSGNIGGEVIGAGGQIMLIPGTVVDRDLNLNGGYVRMDGVVGGDAILNGGEVYINGTVTGNTTIRADVIEIGPDAVLEGNLTYYSQEEAFFSEGATVAGEVDFNQVEKKNDKDKVKDFNFFGFLTGFTVFKTILFSIAALIFALLWRKWTNGLVAETSKEFWKKVLLGFATLVLTPVAVFILFITVVGMVPAGLLLLGFIFAMLLSSVFAGIVTAGLAEKYIAKNQAKDLAWWKIVLGVFVYQLLKFIPVVGWFISFVIFLASLGWILTVVWKVLHKAANK